MSTLIVLALLLSAAPFQASGPAQQPSSVARIRIETAAGAATARDLAGFECSEAKDLGGVLVRFEGLRSTPSPAADDERADVLSPGGDRISGRIRGGRAELVDVEILGSVHLGLALDEISSIVFPARIPALGTVVPAAPSEGDRVYRRAGSGLDVIDGGIEEFTSTGVRIHAENVGSKLVPWSEVAALFVEGLAGSAPVARAPGPGAKVALDLRDGGRLRGTFERLGAEGCRLATRNGEHLLVPAAAIALLSVEDGSFGYLSSLPPASAPPSLPFGDDLGMRWECRVDRSVTGAPLGAAGRQFSRGIGVHAPSRMQWKLDGAWKHLRGSVAVDDEVLRLPSPGSVVFRVLVDGKPRFESRVLRGGDPPAAIERIDLEGAKELELQVDSADGSIVADRADWLEMILWR
jgi:hypothetical protein